MIQLVTAIHVIVCVLLVIVVLLQQGKKDGMGAAFGGGSQSVFGARGAETFLEKFTKTLAIVFMCTSLGLVYLSSKESTGSLLSNEKTQEQPVKEEKPADAAATTETPTATAPAGEENKKVEETIDLKAKSAEKPAEAPTKK